MATEPKLFPINSICRSFPVCAALPRFVPWSLLEPHREQADTNHGQTLERLAERGGLDPCEMWCVINDKKWRDAPTLVVAVAWLLELLESTKRRLR